MKIAKTALITLAGLAVSACQTQPQAVSPVPLAQPIINSIETELTKLPTSYFYPLATEIVTGIQVDLYKRSKVYLAANGQTFLQTKDNKMIALGRYDETQADAVGTMLKPALSSQTVANATISFSNAKIESGATQTFSINELNRLSSVCIQAMAMSANVPSFNLSIRSNSMLNPENFARHKDLQNAQDKTVESILPSMKELFESELPALAKPQLIRPATEYCVALDIQLGEAVRIATVNRVKQLARSRGQARAPLDNLIQLIKESGSKAQAATDNDKPRYSMKTSEDANVTPQLIRCRARNGDVRIVAEKACLNLLKGEVISR